jgi:DHA1 family inner membrane transport protein
VSAELASTPKAGGRFTFVPDGVPARIALAILATAGILYGNIGPVIVSGLAQTAQFTSETAGYVFSANMYGSAIGGFGVVLVLQRINWRISAAVLLAMLMICDLMSANVADAAYLTSLRFLHGLTGGSLIGIGMSVIARTVRPERTFGVVIFIQLGLGGAATALLTPLIATMGMSVVWLSLVGFSAVALALIPLLDAYPIERESVAQTESSATGSETVGGRRAQAPWPMVILAMAALFMYQAGEMSAFAYVMELGKHYGFSIEFMSVTVATSLWIGAPAALFVAWWSTRSGRVLPACGGAVLTTLAVSLLFIANTSAYVLANVGLSIFFSMTIPYLLGIASELDNTGRLAAFAGFVNSLGLATGPAIAAALLGDDHFERVLILAVSCMAVSAILVARPARLLDQSMRSGRVVWESA